MATPPGLSSVVVYFVHGMLLSRRGFSSSLSGDDGSPVRARDQTSGVHTVLGTIAGDDTVLVVCKVGVEGEDLARLFREMAETGLPAKGLVAVN